MELVFVHGYSVRNTATYGELPNRLEQELAGRGLEVRVEHIYLGKYVSFNDSVTLDDLSRAFAAAVREKGLGTFACITHSTGGPLVRQALLHSEVAGLTHLIMLAPANHGSALAQLGKGRLSRIKAFVEAVEPGQKILDWLELGSEEQWAMNLEWMETDWRQRNLFAFVLIGYTIDHKLYDHLNSYTGEPGSDGVVRVAAANLNYTYTLLKQNEGGGLLVEGERRSAATSLGLLPVVAHSGKQRGIMNSVGLRAAHPTVEAILECLAVKSRADYEATIERFQLTMPKHEPYSMVCLRVVDDQGRMLEDYDVVFTAGPNASPDALPKGLIRDRQRNQKHPGRLTYYFNHNKLKGAQIGLEVRARPEQGLVKYEPASIHPQELESLLKPDETRMVEIVLRRLVDRNCFQLTEDRRPSPIDDEPGGNYCQAQGK